ncbi:hypothetical protein GCM10012275_22880 [Longimycelium tulufanense]|uniref:Histidine-specific methyltransferase SAM-dependent domain-containing protein n=1 Tax=Longimycelium tulufanense TaxID=907463 RepID=A0A8J3FUL4_9PSEU|nr:hypothetical protein [Longimycelium tulufanense]GGM51405.1 hypothetical protein GCM10012275_22880 [Longimycelium tulufanense]
MSYPATGELDTPTAGLIDHVRRAVSRYSGIPEPEIIVSENVEKYYDNLAPERVNAQLEQVFHLMWELNRVGLGSPDLGNTGHARLPLVQALRLIVADLRAVAGAEPLQYTELGPEPSKTTFILRSLRAEGVDLRRYTGVDINPASRETMERELATLLPAGRIHYQQTLFSDLARTDYRLPGTRNLVTMLGFAEGNEHPTAVARLLDDILRPGDLFLSEMQLLSPSGWSPVFDFYRTDLMRKFSEITLHRSRPDVESEYCVFLVPLELPELDSPLMAAVTAERIVGVPTGEPGLFVTNYCLKFSAAEYLRLRERSGQFVVVAQRTTADGSIAFQLAQRK